MAELFHIVLRKPTRDESPEAEARREERIYTVFGEGAAWAKFRWLAERWPNCVAEPVLQSPDSREPVC